MVSHLLTYSHTPMARCLSPLCVGANPQGCRHGLCLYSPGTNTKQATRTMHLNMCLIMYLNMCLMIYVSEDAPLGPMVTLTHCTVSICPCDQDASSIPRFATSLQVMVLNELRMLCVWVGCQIGLISGGNWEGEEACRSDALFLTTRSSSTLLT